MYRSLPLTRATKSYLLALGTTQISLQSSVPSVVLEERMPGAAKEEPEIPLRLHSRAVVYCGVGQFTVAYRSVLQFIVVRRSTAVHYSTVEEHNTAVVVPQTEILNSAPALDNICTALQSWCCVSPRSINVNV